MAAIPTHGARFYRALFASTFFISAVTVGGGYVIIPLLKMKYVDEYGWIDDKETLDLVAIAQSMPGIMAVNACVLMGYRIAGLSGALTALAATILPPLITLSLIAMAYDAFASNPYIAMILKGMQCGATALIVNVGIDMMKKQLRKKLLLPLAIIVATFVASYFFHVNVMLLIVIDGLLGLALMRGREYD